MTGTPTLVELVATKGPQKADPNRIPRVVRANNYPKQIWWFLATFIGLLMLFHIGALLVYWRRKRQARSTLPQVNSEKHAYTAEPARSTANGRISLRRLPLAVASAFRIFAYRITIPVGGGNVLNGAEIGVTSGYIIALFTWEFINCRDLLTGELFGVSYWANRAGNIAATQLPLMIVLAGKNNLLSLITGISYEKLNVLHRAAARVNLILIWVHIWGRVKQGLSGSLSLTNLWLRTGVATATAYTLLVIISSRPLRTKFYEFFFFSHFVLVLMILIGAYFHIHIGFGFGTWLIPSFVFWALDRFLRLARVLWHNQPSFSTFKASPLDATAELLSPTMVRLRLTRNMTWRAGQNAFITMPSVSRIPFEAHPFTIASIPRCGISGSDGETSKGGGNEMVFFIRVKEGFTKRLRDTAERQSTEGRELSLSVYVDGPYGSPPDMNAFNMVFLIAGGSGVSYALPLLQDVVYNARQGNTACRSIFFLWAIPHRAHLSWVSNALNEALEAAPPSLQVRIRVHVTQSDYAEGDGHNSEEGSIDNKEHTDAVMDQLLGSDRMTLETGRPDVHVLLEEQLEVASGAVSVDVAGPAELARDVRKALRSGTAGPKAVLKGGPSVTLHVETYGIA